MLFFSEIPPLFVAVDTHDSKLFVAMETEDSKVLVAMETQDSPYEIF